MSKVIGKSEALYSLFPIGEYELRGEYLIWHDATQTEPTGAEITTEVTRLQAAYDSQAYSRQRATAYAALNQFEMQFDDAANSTTTWVDAINAIKQEFPK